MPVVLSHPEGSAGISFKQIASRLLRVRYTPPMARDPEMGDLGQDREEGGIPTNIVPGEDKDESLFNYFRRRFGMK